MVYGNFATGMVDEDTPCEPLGVYGALKFSGEKMVIAYGQAFDLPYTIIRYGSVYGERADGSNRIYRIIRQALTEKKVT